MLDSFFVSSTNRCHLCRRVIRAGQQDCQYCGKTVHPDQGLERLSIFAALSCLLLVIIIVDSFAGLGILQWVLERIRPAAPQR